MSRAIFAADPAKKRNHYGLIDTVRGLCILSMVLYHGMYDVVYLLNVPVDWYHRLPGYLWQQSICWTFLLIAGFCWQMGRHHLKRGLILVGCGAAITLATWLFMPSELIRYGILTLNGLCTLLLIPLHPLLQKIPAGVGLAASFLLFLLLRNVPAGSLGFEGLQLISLPDWLYASPFTAVLGFPAPGFISSDYFPLLPWFFLYLTGYFLWGLLKNSERAKALLRPSFPPLAFPGRHSLLIYVLHQPVLLGIFMVLQKM